MAFAFRFKMNRVLRKAEDGKPVTLNKRLTQIVLFRAGICLFYNRREEIVTGFNYFFCRFDHRLLSGFCGLLWGFKDEIAGRAGSFYPPAVDLLTA
ncbi:MAG TPA: hypothetical protein VJA21_32100 [Verrucomicrobiae bacterium]